MFEDTLKAALLAQTNGKFEKAEELCKTILKKKSDHFHALQILGITYFQTRKYADAELAFKRALDVNSEEAALHNNHGATLEKLGKLREALKAFDLAIKLKPNYIEALFNKGLTLKRLGDLEEALDSFEVLISLGQRVGHASAQKAALLRELGNYEDATTALNKAVESGFPKDRAYSDQGLIFFAWGSHQRAIECFDSAIHLNPEEPSFYVNRGLLYSKLHKYSVAIKDFKTALSLDPTMAIAHNNLGTVYQEKGCVLEAESSYKNALAIDSSYAEAYHNLGTLYRSMYELEEALRCFKEALRLNPNYPFLKGIVLHLSCQICAWTDFRVLLDEIVSGVSIGLPVSGPFPLLAAVDNPTIHRKAAQLWASSKFSIKPRIKVLPPRIGERIRVAFISSDFYQHATSFLLAELIELYDRDRFEFVGLSYGAQHHDEMRTRLANAFHQFEDVSALSDFEIASLCRNSGTHIAVDLKGYTSGSRPGIFAERAAPIQIAWLGYPGTMATPAIDFIFADRHVLPESEFENYSEKVIWLQPCYQVNDSKRVIAPKSSKRIDYGLPEGEFVFCCFNNGWKILPEVFDSWMKILARCERSVLWLLQDNPEAATNLRLEAVRRGIASNRIVFCHRVALADHLERHQLADLSLDTWPYNAHTTASDALWAGLPMLTLRGKSFASRVCSSLLTALGLERLVTDTSREYEDLACSLYEDRDQLALVRKQLADQRATSPLFDARHFSAEMESAFKKVLNDSVLHSQEVDETNESSWNSNSLRPALNAPNISRHERHALHDHHAVLPAAENSLFELLGWEGKLQILDVGASVINGVPPYQKLLDSGYGYLNAVDGDYRTTEKILAAFRPHVTIYPQYLYDGSEQTVFLASEESGMTSILEPDPLTLDFFNGFSNFGKVEGTARINTSRLDDFLEMPWLDFIKLDAQGSELGILKNGKQKLRECIAIQTEVSFLPLYQNQPCFGEVDNFLRLEGFVPHRFLEVKRWSIRPTIRDGDIRKPFNQLLEADILYIRQPFQISLWSDTDIQKLAILAHYVFDSPDLVIYALSELDRRIGLDSASHTLRQRYVEQLKPTY